MSLYLVSHLYCKNILLSKFLSGLLVCKKNFLALTLFTGLPFTIDLMRKYKGYITLSNQMLSDILSYKLKTEMGATAIFMFMKRNGLLPRDTRCRASTIQNCDLAP